MSAPTETELRTAYRGKRVLVTGHTGFKGGWLSLWLAELGAKVVGLALPPDTTPSLFAAAKVADFCEHHEGDVRNLEGVRSAIAAARPDYIFHLAAQPLVRLSYAEPVATLATNVMGTAHVLDALRGSTHPCAVVIVTSDKCYENREWLYGYREHEPMGGHDVYSMSKGAAELVVASFRRSFFAPENLAQHGIAVASARSGNVIGGGDWAQDRIVPDAVQAIAAGRPVGLRNPGAVRPWQHVLEPLSGYLLLGARLAGIGASASTPAAFCDGWNFGPPSDRVYSVRDVAEAMVKVWGKGSWADQSSPNAPHEANMLRLSTEKANLKLGWRARWDFHAMIEHTAAWYRGYYDGAGDASVSPIALCQAQIRAYMTSAA